MLDNDVRTVTFSNGFIVKERIVSITDMQCRLTYTAMGGRASHHNASFQVFAEPGGGARVLWVTDLLPEDVRAPIEQMDSS